MSLREKTRENWKKAYNKLAEDYFTLQHEYDEYRKNAVSGILYVTPEERENMNTNAWDNTACGCSSTPSTVGSNGCGPTYTVDKAGIVEATTVEGTYTITVIKN